MKARASARPLLVLLHRYAGLATAVFLVLTGVTGGLLAWYHELDGALNARWMKVALPTPGAAPIPPLVLREKVLQAFPAAEVHHVRLVREPGRAAEVWLTPRDRPLPVDQVFVDPYTGEVLGARKWGDVSQGWTNLMPFVYRLHHQLALGSVGSWVLGVVALLWTADCIVGAWLTLPRGRPTTRRWWSGWCCAWKVRSRRGVYQTQFDLHRAAGLWFWAILFVLAWSSVGLNLDAVYRPVMHTLFEHQAPPPSARPEAGEAGPPMSWADALHQGERLMAELAHREGLVVERPDRLMYDPGRALYRYVASTDRDVAERFGSTSVYFHAGTGEWAGSFVPTGKAAGDTVTHWLTALHLAALWGRPYQAFMTVTGLAVAFLSMTGAYLWWRKGHARRRLRKGLVRGPA